MKRVYFLGLLAPALLLLPVVACAQVSSGVDQLHDVLNNVYNQMVPMCADLIQVCQAIAGIGTLFYIGVRVWKHLARAEAIDMFPLFRPMVMVLLIGIYPYVLGFINAVLNPSVSSTAAKVTNSNAAVQTLLAAETQLTPTSPGLLMVPSPGSQQGWDKYAQPDATNSDDSGGGILSFIGSGFKFLAGGIEAGFRYVFRFLVSIIMQILYFAAALCIDTIRTFHLIVLAILGPFVFAFSCYDGFQHSLTNWLARYINIYLWLPIANLWGAILGKIQENMTQIDLTRIQNGDISFFSATDIAYIVFLVIGVVGYFTIPGIANYVVHTHSPNPLLNKVNGLAGMAASAGVGAATGGAGGAASAGASGSGSAGNSVAKNFGYETTSGGQPYDPYQYERQKIAG